jgi:sulfur carrier protein ThiS
MKIELRLYATLASHMPKKTGGGSECVEINEGTRIRELLEQLEIPSNAVKVVFLNGVHASGDQILKDGDRVGVFPPIGGG